MSKIEKNKGSFSTLKIKLFNTLMSHGKKNIAEKIILNSTKRIYKLQPFHFKSLLKLALLNSTPIFKLNERIIKRGKRKIKKQVPFFLVGDSNRIMNCLKAIKAVSIKARQNRAFYESFSEEILNLVENRSVSITKNNEIKTEVLSSKRHLSKFRW